MRLYLPVLAGLLLSAPVQSLTFQPRLENAAWQVEGDRFECRLIQPVSGFGRGAFVRRAGEQPRFRLQAEMPWFGKARASLLSAAAIWQPGQRDIPLGVLGEAGGEALDSSYAQASQLLNGLLEGRTPLVRQRLRPGSELLEVRLLPVHFAKAYDEFLACGQKLLPHNFDQLKVTQIPMPDWEISLNEKARARLDGLLDYMKEDPAVNRIYLDGHSDNGSDRLTSREMSRRRALAVQAYLVARGVPESAIVVRFHGERYPLASNRSHSGRLKNRRVTVHLAKEPVQQTPPA